MKKYLFIGVLIFILILSVFVMSAKDNKPGKVEQKVINELEKEGKARVIVVLKDSPTNDKKKVSEFRASQRNEIKEKIDSTKIRHDFSYSNAFSASLSAKDIKSLSLDDNVKQIYYDKPVKAFLQDSVNLINATKTWNLQANATNLTGKGETICIIDTGVDYTHPDLGNCTPVRYTLNGTNESYVLQSAHNYTNSFDYIWNITREGYSKIGVYFVNISTECTYDYIYILDGSRNIVSSYSCSLTNFWSPSVNGDTIYIQLKSDEASTNYGFYVGQVINGTTNATYNWSNCSKIIGGWDNYNYDSDPMDDNGHGTHVAGIAAANGTIKGAAPDAQIISIKALDASGNGYSGDAAKGIEWCTNRSENFNISVISMSLGTSNYWNASYCDSYDAVTAAAINAASAKNISVIVAAGNEYKTNSISFPACIQNATPIGASDKSDSIESYSNRNSLVQLFATGSSINSTKNGGDYEILSGTSMATPHAAGAFAIINQLLKLTGQTKTSQEIESIFNATGKIIYDSSSGLNFSRINVYNATLYLDNIAPNLTLASPTNNTISPRQNQTFECDSNDWQLLNITFYLWNSSSLVYNETKNISGTGNETNFSVGLVNESYKWTCKVFDAKGNNYLATNSSLEKVSDTTNPSVTLLSPDDSTSSTISAYNFTFNASDNFNPFSCVLVFDDSVINSIDSLNNGTSGFYNSSLAVGSHAWQVNCTDLAGNTGNSSIRNLVVNSPPGSTGGGGGGTSFKTYKATSSELSDGFSASLGQGDKIEFQSSSGDSSTLIASDAETKSSVSEHIMTINSIGINFVNITIRSNPINLKLAVGESRKLNISYSDFYDLYVKLESIKSGKANITLKSIYERIIGIKENEQEINETISETAGEMNQKSAEKISALTNTLNDKIIFIVIFCLVLVLIYWRLRERKKSRK